MQVDDFELLYPQGLLCNIDNVPEGLGSVYLITDLTNDKVYVGQTWYAVRFRWNRHLEVSRAGSKIHFHNAIRLRGKESFSVGLLGVGSTQEELDSLESLWILLLNSTNPKFGYNGKFGGSRGRHTEEGRKQISERLQLEWKDPIVRDRRASAINASRQTDEYRKGQSKRLSTLWQDPAFRERVETAITSPDALENRSKSMIEVWKDNPQRKQIASNQMKELWQDEGYRERRKAGLQKALQTPEYKENLAKAIAKLWANPDFVENHHKAVRTPENRKKLSEIQTELWADPGRRKKLTDIHKAQWADPAFYTDQMAKRAATKLRKEQEKVSGQGQNCDILYSEPR